MIYLFKIQPRTLLIAESESFTFIIIITSLDKWFYVFYLQCFIYFFFLIFNFSLHTHFLNHVVDWLNFILLV